MAWILAYAACAAAFALWMRGLPACREALEGADPRAATIALAACAAIWPALLLLGALAAAAELLRAAGRRG